MLAEVIINETDRFKLEEKTDVELEGVIDSSPGAGEFLLSGYRVKFDAERTEIEGAMSLKSLQACVSRWKVL